MCRLYGFHSTAPRKVECELIQSQNSLIAQSLRDEQGKSNPDGWGLVTYNDRKPRAERQKTPAFNGEDFRWAAAKAYSRTVMAHVRRATIGAVIPENTHPFVYGQFSFSHNGTIDAFPLLQDRIMREIAEPLRGAIGGTTDSEHFFYLLLSRHLANGGPMTRTLADCANLVAAWSADEDPTAEVALNVIWTDGTTMVGSRLGRSLWYTARREVHRCEVCGSMHAIGAEDEPYRAVVVASEKVTSTEEWISVQNGSVFEIADDFHVKISGL